MPRYSAEDTYKRVKEIVDAKGVTNAEAIKEVAKATKRSPNSVSVTFYKAQRDLGGGGRKKAGRKPGRAAAAKPGRPRGRRGARKVAARASARAATARRGRGGRGGSRAKTILDQLAAVIESQQREIERLRDEARRFSEIQKLLNK